MNANQDPNRQINCSLEHPGCNRVKPFRCDKTLNKTSAHRIEAKPRRRPEAAREL